MPDVATLVNVTAVNTATEILGQRIEWPVFCAPTGASRLYHAEGELAVARAAAIPVIAVTFGYSETPVALLKPDRIVTRFDQLPDLVFALADAKTQIAPKS